MAFSMTKCCNYDITSIFPEQETSPTLPTEVWFHEDEKIYEETVHERPPLVLLGQQ